MEYILGLITGGIIMLGFLCARDWIKVPYKYKYVCHEEGCQFSASTNDLGIYGKIAEVHGEHHAMD